MLDTPQKNKRRAMRRKRNLVAKQLILDKQFRPKRVEPKRKRQKLRIKDVETEDLEGGTLEDQDTSIHDDTRVVQTEAKPGRTPPRNAKGHGI